MDMDYKTLKLENQNSVLLVTLNRPESRNAINFEMMQELFKLWRELYINVDKIRCVILTGAEKAFCAGADLKERHEMSVMVWLQQRAVLEQAMLAMLDCPIPIISAVNGAAFGGGLELLLASDFAYAASTATFAQSEVRVGLIPGALGTQHLPRACGLRRAKELTFTAAVFSAQEAFEWGIINKICEPDSLLSEVFNTANLIVDNAPLAIQQVKKSLNMSQQVDVKSGFAFEIEAYNRVLGTKDREEGIRAFNEKRKPLFVGN
ncbi:MAG TPA: enoyl-CoA hydratase-related protein [Candidatus Babeliaceae bacterium]|nr:enoyl-CoA hydratase-related protein [Candidatus Babeliaceae bacterium]